jgi:hypothetical protein
MHMTSVRDHKTARRRTTAMVMAAGLFLPTAARAQRDTTAGVALRPGLVIHPGQGVAYVMAAAGGIAAVDLTSGATRWTSSEGGRPLALVGSVLLAQVDPKSAGNHLELVGLNTRERGARTVRSTVTLAPGVRVSLGETLQGDFSLDARPVGGDVLLNWSFVPVPRQGMPDPVDTLDVLRLKGRTGRPARVRGALRMNLATGQTKRVDTATVPEPPTKRWILPPGEKLVAAGAATTQYESADGRHIVASERLDDDRVWAKYRWTVYERGSGRRLGEFRTHLSFTPFVVRDSLLVYETTPYAVGSEEGQPAKLRAINLTTGQEAWSVAVRETVYRGPFPP